MLPNLSINKSNPFKYLFLISFVLLIISCRQEIKYTTAGIEIIPTSGKEKYLTLSDDYIFNQDSLYTFEINLPDSSLAFLDSDPAAEEYVEGSLTFNGETLSPVGIRYKGSIGSFVGAVSGPDWSKPSGHKIATKLSMKIKIDWQDYRQTFYGLRKLQFHSMNLDRTQLHDRLGYWLYGQMGVPSPRCVHARLIINGTYYGVHALIEQIDEQFAARNFSEGTGNLYKEIWPLKDDGNAQPVDVLNEALETNKEVADTNYLIRNFAQNISIAGESDLQSVIEKYMDIDKILTYAVVDRTIRNDDGAFHWYCFGDRCKPHNFFWYEEPSRNKVHLIPWDLDHAFVNIISDVNPVTPIGDDWGGITNDCMPFEYGRFGIKQRSAACDKLTGGWASYPQEYNAIKTQFINGPFSESSVNLLLDKWTTQIRQATIDASEAHEDALKLEEWENAVIELRAQLAHARGEDLQE